jgi:DNA-binding transcriptional ArsR family regulator
LPSGSTNCAKVTTSGVEIAEVLPVGRPAVSQHLKVLKRAGLVSDRAVGPRRVYGVDQRGLEAADMRTSTALE